MKKIIVSVLFCILLLITSALPTIISKEPYENHLNYESFEYITGDYLLTTEWEQWGPENDKCPMNECATDPNDWFRDRLGCWSVAIGQIINYHSSNHPELLQSTGTVSYDCSYRCMKPWQIQNNLDEYDYDWFQMEDKLEWISSPEKRDNVSRLLFDTATVIQKNFGTGGYGTIVGHPPDVSNLIAELIEHFPAISESTVWENDLTAMDVIVEIDHNRPIMFYMDTPSVSAHAVVLDGYMIDIFVGLIVHLNYGWDGTNNGWYPYNGPFPGGYDDPDWRKGLLIRLVPWITYFEGDPLFQVINKECIFTATCEYDTDPPMHYMFDWDDGNSYRWLGPFELGVPCTTSHSWSSPGIYNIKVKAKNNMGSQSDWSESLPVYITRYEPLLPVLEFLLDLKDQFPLLEPYITIIIELICS
jgi:hypothetical protein